MNSRRNAAVAGLGYAFAVTMFGTTLPTPLYPLYRQDLGFSELLVTVIYAVYAGGVLTALLLFGALSDRIGRRPVLLAAVALSAASAICFLAQGGLPPIFAGRVLSGLSAGLVTGTATATMTELVSEARRPAATLGAALVNMAGLGLGPLLAGLVSQHVGAPLRTIFVVDLVLLVPAVVCLLLLPGKPAAEREFRITVTRLAVPAQVRGAFVSATTVGFGGFVVLGLFTSVVPSALGALMDIHDRGVVGATVFAIFFASLVGQVAVNRLGRIALPLGCVLIIVGMGVLAGALQVRSLALLVLAALLAGAGQGASFRAGLGMVTAASPADQRGSVTSAYFAVLYVGLSLPVIAVGWVAQSQGLRHTAMVTAGVVGVLALGTLASVMPRRRNP